MKKLKKWLQIKRAELVRWACWRMGLDQRFLSVDVAAGGETFYVVRQWDRKGNSVVIEHGKY